MTLIPPQVIAKFQQLDKNILLTACFSFLQVICDAIPGKNLQRRDLDAHAQPYLLFSTPHPAFPILAGNTCKERLSMQHYYATAMIVFLGTEN